MLTRRSVIERPCLSRRRIGILGLQRDKKEGAAIAAVGSFPNTGGPGVSAWTLVLATYARSRRNSQGMPKGRSGRNLKTYYRPGAQIYRAIGSVRLYAPTP